MDKRRKQIIESNEVSQIFTFTLGGIPQKVLIEGKKKDLPVVIALHGGPGSPIPFSVGCRGMFPEFTDRFLMVCWDQLGCGINDYKIEDKFNIDSYIDMTIDLVREVKNLFPENQLILFGVSWGTVLCANVVQRVPEYIDAVVAWGQVVKNLFFNDEVFETLGQADLPKKKQNQLTEIRKQPPQEKALPFLTGCIRKYTQGYQNKKDEATPMAPIIKGLLTSPDYKFKDFKAIMVNGCTKSKLLWPELLKIDLTEKLLSVSKPYYILQGDTDIVTSTKNIQNMLEQTDNPNLYCEVIKNSGHMPGKTGMDAIFEALVHLTNS